MHRYLLPLLCITAAACEPAAGEDGAPRALNSADGGRRPPQAWPFEIGGRRVIVHVVEGSDKAPAKIWPGHFFWPWPPQIAKLMASDAPLMFVERIGFFPYLSIPDDGFWHVTIGAPEYAYAHCKWALKNGKIQEAEFLESELEVVEKDPEVLESAGLDLASVAPLMLKK